MKKLFNFGLALMMILSMALFSQTKYARAEDTLIIVDDHVTEPVLDHYFIYSDDRDEIGETGWSDSDASFGSGELKTQHWVWNENNTEASEHWYSFTFTGTGADLVGITPTGSTLNVFQLDEEEPEILSIPSDSTRKESVLYSVRDLTYGKHTIRVTLPDDGSQTGLQISYARVYGAQESTVLTEKILPTDIEGSANVFRYHDTKDYIWTSSEMEAYISLGTDPSQASDAYYEIPFVGNAIQVYANKSFNHGIVRFSVDGENVQDVDLYSENRQMPAVVYEISNLEEGAHTLKAQLTGEKNGSTFVNQVAYAVIYHEKYEVEDILPEAETISMVEGASHQLRYTVVPDYAEAGNLIFESRDPRVAEVDPTGIISAVGVGETDIVMLNEESTISKQIHVTVKEAVPALGGTIVDTDTQYTQDRYEEVRSMGMLSDTVTVWKNDAGISEISLYSIDCALDDVSVRASDFTSGENVIESNNIELTFIRSTKAYNGSYLGYGSTTRPVPEDDGSNRSEANDILYQSEPVDIGFNQLQNVWVEIKVPEDTPAGIYQGTITASSSEIDEPLEFEYRVEVMDAVLPDAETFNESFDIELWQYPYSSAEYYEVTPFSDEHFEYLKPIMTKYKEIGGSAITASIVEEAWSGQTYSSNDIHYPSMIRWERQDDGSFTYDYSDFDAWIEFNERLGIDGKIVLYSIAPWHNSFAYWDDGELIYERFSAGSDRYIEVWTDFLNKLIAHLEEKGWFERTYIGIDERGFSHAAFDVIDAVKNSKGESLKTAGALGAIRGEMDLAMRVTDLNVGDNVPYDEPEAFASLLSKREQLGLRTTLYTCTEHQPGNFALSAPAESYWSVMNAGKQRTSGLLRWAYDAWVEDPLNDTTHNAFEAGDCFLVYPGDKQGVPSVRSSVRLEKMAEALRDINKLRLIETEFPQMKDKIAQLYDVVKTESTITQHYMTDEQIEQLSAELTEFKACIDEISREYIKLKDNHEDAASEAAIQALRNMVDKAVALGSDDAALNEAIANAQAVLAKETPTATEVVTALLDLSEAMQALNTDESTDALRADVQATIDFINENILNDVEGLRPGKVQVLKDAVRAAQDVVNDPDATADELKATNKAMTKAAQELWEIVTKAELEALIEAANGYLDGDYTAESLEALQAAIDAAQAVAENDDTTVVEVTEAITNLNSMIAGLETITLDTSALEHEIELVSEMVANIDDYIAISVEGLADKLADAQNVLENATSQTEIDEAVKSLREARLNARTKADTSALEEIIAYANSLDLSGYSRASVAALNQAIAQNKLLLSDPEASQDAVDDAVTEIQNVIDALEPVSETAGSTTADSTNTAAASTMGMMAALMAAAGAASVMAYRRKRS